MERLPRPRQAQLLTQIRDGHVTVDGEKYRAKPAADRSKGRNVTAQVAVIRNHDWVEDAEDGLVLTSYGNEALADATAVATVAAMPAQDRPRVSITRRRRGNHAVAGMGKVPDGRNVECWDCYQQQQADHEAGTTRYRPELVVWFTNEGGREAQREAEIALARHVMTHHMPDVG